ncbi:hypothetical protein EJB05_12200 [Eragrostis curvula]|uniref:Uncharacterized protein n=1 Tax=Eragrostis curvula TaxID=38414 RepID=A0A5J9VRM5_9POAL|nr:hypothetical protein EJB05_12200 [Eragrostis curvula]
MEDLVSSSSFKSVLSCSEGQAQSVESSWTDYFVDFMLSEEEKRRQDASYCATVEEDDGDGSNYEEEEEEDSMISDAASCAPAALLPCKYKELKKLKKAAFKAMGHDDSLEDTASSPVNSPKVSVLSQMEMSPNRRCNIRDLTKEDGIGHDHRMEGMDYTDATNTGVRFVDQSDRSIVPCAELKDKGICLFPLSMLLHYHGRN